MSLQNKPHYVILAFILFVGLILRFWHPFSIPFVYDELSALYRLRFDTFDELIKKGVMADGHPAGVQVFLYYWTKAFGTREIVVKLPFLLAGVASIHITFLLGKQWFSATTGLLSAAYVASLQMFVMYSQIARPYISGLFVCLMMVYFWSRYLFGTGKTKHLILFVIFASLASYNHHFSLLFAAIVGITGLWFLNRKTVLPYIVSGVAIFVLYIPHLPIFFSQLQLGSMVGTNDWISKPEPWFLFQFLKWLLHYSWWVAGLLAGIVLLPAFGLGHPHRFAEATKKHIVLLSWFFLPIIIGYAYSVFINPVLQYSMLIFTSPFLFLLLFSFTGRIPVKYLSIIVTTILVVNITTLIYGRSYYEVFYKQPFEQLVKNAITLEKENPGEVFIIHDYVPYYINYYFDKYNRQVPSFTIRNKNITAAEYKEALKGIEQDIVIISGLRGNYFQMIKEQFPYWIGFETGFTYEQYVFSKTLKPDQAELKRELIAQTDFGSEGASWQYNRRFIIVDSTSGDEVFQFGSGQTYGLGIEIPLQKFLTNSYQVVDVVVEIKPLDSLVGGAIVAELISENELMDWHGSNIGQFGLLPGAWQNTFLTLDIQAVMKNHQVAAQGSFLKLFIWNRQQDRFLIRKISIFSRPGNRKRYLLFYE